MKIQDYCFSACANYLALAGKTLTLPCSALLGWHGSPTLQTDEDLIQQSVLAGHPAKLTEKLRNWHRDFRNLEQDFFRSRGINYALLADSVAIPKSEDLGPVVTFQFDDDTGNYSVSSSASMWIPTASVLMSYGVETKDFCKDYGVSEIRTAMNSYGLKIRFSSNGKSVVPAGDIERAGSGKGKSNR